MHIPIPLSKGRLFSDSSTVITNYPKSIPLMSSKERMKCRNIKRVLRYHTPNSIISAEAYAHHM